MKELKSIQLKDYKKIFITGIYGTGKTTLAKKLSNNKNIKYYELDDIKYKRHYDIIRTVGERKEILNDITNKKEWIIEGSWIDYAKDAYERADIVIYLDTSERKLYHRIILRWIKRKTTSKIYTGKTQKKFRLLRNTWKYFHEENYFLTRKKHLKYIQKHAKKYMIIKNNKYEKIIGF